MRTWSKVYTGSVSRYDFDAQAFVDLINDIGGNMSEDGSGTYAGVSLKITAKSGTHALLSFGNASTMIDAPSSAFLNDIFSTKIIGSDSIEFYCFVYGEEGGNIAIRNYNISNTQGYGLFITKSDNTSWVGAYDSSGNNARIYLKNGIVNEDNPSPVIQVSTSDYNSETINDVVLVPYIISEDDGGLIKNGFVTSSFQYIGNAITLGGKHLISTRIHNVIGYIIDTIENLDEEVSNV